MKNSTRQIRTLAIVLLFIILALAIIAGTYAKYTTNTSGSDSARVAHWKIDSNNTINNLFATKYDNVVGGTDEEGVIAPGTSGSFVFDITGNVETNYNLSVVAEGSDNVKDGEYSPIRYSFTDNTNSESPVVAENLTFDELKQKINEISATNQTAGEVKKGPYTIGWEWPYENSNDLGDTNIGNKAPNASSIASEKAKGNDIDNVKATLTVSITATQVD